MLTPTAFATTNVDAVYEEGLRAAKSGRHLEAGALFLEAFGIDPNPSLLWNAARSYESGGDMVRAHRLYEQYTGLPDAKPDKIERARRWLETHQGPQVTATSSAPEAAKTDADNAQSTAPVVTLNRPETHTATDGGRQLLGWVLCGAGIAASLGGSLAMVMAAQTRDESYTLRWGESYQASLARHKTLTETTEAREAAGWISLSLAAGLIGSGLAVMLAGDSEDTESEVTFGLSPTPGGLSAGGTWSF